MTDGGMAAAPNLPDLDALALERIQLQRRLKDLSRRHERLQERLATYPNQVTEKQAARVAAELDEVNRRIDSIDATLIPLRLSPFGRDE
jgi:predicted  nucleic acid-binding Zn-ribbon protein